MRGGTGKLQMTVYIVEDSEIISSRLTKMISEIRGARVVGVARTGVDALRFLNTNEVALVTLDIQMPSGSGVDVLRAVKSLPNPPMVIVLTNYTHEVVQHVCLQAGADYFLDKSVEFEKVIEIIRDLSVSKIDD